MAQTLMGKLSFRILLLAVLAALAGGMIVASQAGGESANNRPGAAVSPIPTDLGNSSLANECAGYDDGFKFDPTGDEGTAGVVTLGAVNGDDLASWSSTIPVGAVYVKGGPQGGNLYIYNPPSLGDTDLTTSDGSDISHITFCWDDPVPTATPTNTPVPPTATPTNTPVPPTATPTNTPVPPTATPTNTPVPTPTNPPGPTPTPTPGYTLSTPTPTPDPCDDRGVLTCDD
jgi:hypothetical protein